MEQSLFELNEAVPMLDPQTKKETCLNCEHRERHQCGGSIIQYCGIRKSNRTYNGQLKIKCKTPACDRFKKSINNTRQ